MKVQRFVVYPYKMSSEAGKLVSKALDALRVYPDKEYKPKSGDFIINWGNGHIPTWRHHLTDETPLLNHWSKVNDSINKIDTFSLFKKAGVVCPPWTISQDKAEGWAEGDKLVCCRQMIEGKDGEGLVLAKAPGAIVPAKLYTQYIPIAKEFRAYVIGGKMIDLMEKRRDGDLLAAGKVDQEIRTESRGWVFCRYGFNAPVGIEKQAVDSIKALNLDFGGVDIILGKDGRLYTLETNTAPGIGGITVDKFIDGFKKLAAAA